MSQEERPLRLHLGCGETYLDGYVNIDFPSSEHTIARVKADRYADLRTLEYGPGTVEEIRNHHVFEHFNRGEALGLLIKWRKWLKPGGILMIETPDFEESARELLNVPLEKKGPLIRHIFGSQEANWALHYDGWFEEKFRFVLELMGFEIIRIVKMKNNVSKKLNYQLTGVLDAVASLLPDAMKDTTGVNTLPNILCVAKKTMQPIEDMKVAETILAMYLIGKEKEGRAILRVWMEDVRRVAYGTSGS